MLFHNGRELAGHVLLSRKAGEDAIGKGLVCASMTLESPLTGKKGPKRVIDVHEATRLVGQKEHGMLRAGLQFGPCGIETLEQGIPMPLAVTLKLDLAPATNGRLTHDKPRALLERAVVKKVSLVRPLGFLEKNRKKRFHVDCLATVVSTKNHLTMLLPHEFVGDAWVPRIRLGVVVSFCVVTQFNTTAALLHQRVKVLDAFVRCEPEWVTGKLRLKLGPDLAEMLGLRGCRNAVRTVILQIPFTRKVSGIRNVALNQILRKSNKKMFEIVILCGLFGEFFERLLVTTAHKLVIDGNGSLTGFVGGLSGTSLVHDAAFGQGSWTRWIVRP